MASQTGRHVVNALSPVSSQMLNSVVEIPPFVQLFKRLGLFKSKQKLINDQIGLKAGHSRWSLTNWLEGRQSCSRACRYRGMFLSVQQIAVLLEGLEFADAVPWIKPIERSFKANWQPIPEQAPTTRPPSWLCFVDFLNRSQSRPATWRPGISAASQWSTGTFETNGQSSFSSLHLPTNNPSNRLIWHCWMNVLDAASSFKFLKRRMRRKNYNFQVRNEITMATDRPTATCACWSISAKTASGSGSAGALGFFFSRLTGPLIDLSIRGVEERGKWACCWRSIDLWGRAVSVHHLVRAADRHRGPIALI